MTTGLNCCISKNIFLYPFQLIQAALSGEEIVERGLSVLGLTARPVFVPYTHTKPYIFRVGNLVGEWFSAH